MRAVDFNANLRHGSANHLRNLADDFVFDRADLVKNVPRVFAELVDFFIELVVNLVGYKELRLNTFARGLDELLLVRLEYLFHLNKHIRNFVFLQFLSSLRLLLSFVSCLLVNRKFYFVESALNPSYALIDLFLHFLILVLLYL